MINLDILIPTFNRAVDLLRCLRSINVAAANSGLWPRIVVIDNASLDETAAVCDQFRLEYPRFFYQKNEKNIGGELNFWKCIKSAEASYFWILGDDDDILPDVFLNIQKILDKKPRIVIINYSVWSAGGLVKCKSAMYPWRKQRSFDAQLAMKVFHGRLGYISGCIFENDVPFISKISEAYFDLVPTHYAFCYYTYAHMAAGNKRRIIYIPEIIIRNIGSSVSYDWYFVFVDGVGHVLKSTLGCGYDRNVVNKAIVRAQWFYLKQVLIPDLANNRVPNDLSKRIKNQWLMNSFSGYILTLLVQLPRWPFSIIRTIKRNLWHGMRKALN